MILPHTKNFLFENYNLILSIHFVLRLSLFVQYRIFRYNCDIILKFDYDKGSGITTVNNVHKRLVTR